MFSSSRDQMHAFGVPRPMPSETRWKPNVEIAPNCPRCDSSNTKFCYYNNYSLTQPRYFCKGCRRYWTKGGSLRNVPVGGGCRKNRRGKSVRLSARSGGPVIGSNAENYGRQIPQCALRPDLALEDMVGSSHQPMLPESPQDASTIDLAALYSKFLSQGQAELVPEPAEPIGGPDPLGGSEGEMGMMGELAYPFDEMNGYDPSMGLTTAAEAEALPFMPWQAPELLCPFPGMGCDWGSLDQSSFGAF